MEQERDLCLGVDGDSVTLKPKSDETTNWRIMENTGAGGDYIENLLDCRMMKAEENLLKMSDKAGTQSQSWAVEEIAGETWYSELTFRFHNKDMPKTYTIDATNKNMKMNPQVENAAGQIFVINEDDNIVTECPEPKMENIDIIAFGGKAGQN